MEEVYIKNESPFTENNTCGQNEQEETKISINNLLTESDNEFQFL